MRRRPSTGFSAPNSRNYFETNEMKLKTAPTCPARVCIYARVSTTRQAKNDLSIPDQIERGEQWCTQNACIVADTVIEPGASATDDDRPHFQQMIARATSDERPFDIILVHSLSRMFRNALHYM
jgi:DNA invertase Pin-like site-specific DNA recombinase